MPASQPTRTLAAIVFTDIVGYSALVHRDDANALKLVNEHFALVREIATGFGGKVIKTIGDSVHLEFASAQAATMCAIAIQQRHEQRNARVAEPQRFDIRIGIHLGDVDHSGGDIYGDGVNIAARLQPLAPVGGIAISGDVRRQLREELRGRFTSRGPQDLKNISTPVEVLVIEAGAIGEISADPGATLRTAPEARRPFPVRAALAVLAVVIVLAIALAFFQKRGPSPAPVVGDKSIAVLPFANLSSDKDQEYFSDGIAEDVLNLLAKIPELRVIARTSSFSYKGGNTPITEIARALQVGSVLQGSVRKSGDQVRIAVQLIQAKDSTQLWSETYDRQLDDVFRIQDEIASAVVSQLRIQLLGKVPTAKPVDPKVYPMILQAHALFDQGSADAWKEALALFQQAVAIAPNEARAWAGMGRVYFNQVVFGQRPAVEGARLAKDAANRALELDPANVIAILTLGRIAADFEFDLASAARRYEQALALEPAHLVAINSSAILLSNMGRTEEGLALYEYRVAQDPANPIALINLGTARYNLKQWDAAMESFRATLRLSPRFAGARGYLALAMLAKHDAAGALKEMEAEPEEPVRLGGMAIVLSALGRRQESDAALEALKDRYGAEGPGSVAAVYAYRGDADAAFEWLNRGADIRDSLMTGVLTEPMFESLRGDPRWLPLLRRIGYAPEQLEKVQFEVTLPAASAAAAPS